MKKVFLILSLFYFIFIVSCKDKKGSEVMNMQKITVTSNAFSEGELIPSKYTCDGEDISPQLSWSNIPENTKSIVVICDDPDAPMGTWVHWILFNIPASMKELNENFLIKDGKIKGIKAGINDFRKLDYGGPCPPGGIHRYFFKVYALNRILNANEGITKKDLLKLMEGHIIGKGELIGKYKRQR